MNAASRSRSPTTAWKKCSAEPTEIRHRSTLSITIAAMSVRAPLPKWPTLHLERPLDGAVCGIDDVNIYHANMRAMQRAFDALPERPGLALVDGRARPPLDCAVQTIVKGDRRSLSIAAASVIAKVTRDRLMHALADSFPDYGWHTNVGYGTDAHYLGLLRKGPTEHHRRSFAPLNTLFAPDTQVLGALIFRRLRGRPDLERLRLLQLRQDLHAVFDGGDHHLGVLKNLRGRWTFQAMGYDDAGRLLAGGGPCAGCHGLRLAGPDGLALAKLLAARLS